MDKSEVISILRNKEILLMDCKQKLEAQELEKEKVSYDERLSFLYQESMEYIKEERNKINFVWFYYLQLPACERALLDELYVKQNGWEYVMQKFRWSKRKVSQIKDAALERIIQKLEQEKGE